MDMEALQQPARLNHERIKGPLRRGSVATSGPRDCPRPRSRSGWRSSPAAFAISDRAWRASSRRQVSAVSRRPMPQVRWCGNQFIVARPPGPGAAPARSPASATAVSRSTKSAELAVVVPERTRAGGTTARGAGSQTVFRGPRSRQLISAQVSVLISFATVQQGS
jgi:hypothetical protein